MCHKNLLLYLRGPAYLALGASLLLTGCGRDEIKVYRVPKESASRPAGHPDAAAPRATPPLTWKTPKGWTTVAPGEMRAASFNIKGQDNKQADVSVIPLSGAAGGDFNNVNRWRGQVGLQPVGPDELKQLGQRVELAGQPADLYEFAGKNPGSGEPTRVLAIIHHREGTAWFFKMTGDDELVAQQKPAFVEFAKSCEFATPETSALPPDHPPLEGATLPPDHPDISATVPAPAAPLSTEGKPNWTVPAGWKEVPGGQFLVAKFVVAGEGDAQAAVNVSSSAGDGGGFAANVNRWRKQLGLNEAAGDEGQAAKTVETAGGKTSFVELSGVDARTGKPTALVGAMVSQPGQAWFYKLMGDPKVVEAQKNAFMKFVQNVKY